MTIQQLRPLILALLGALSAFGLLPADVKALIEGNADAILGGVLALWAVIAHLRNRKDAKSTPRFL